MKILFRGLIVSLLAVSACSGVPVDSVKMISNRDYAPALFNSIINAEEYIHIVMYSVGYYPDHPEGVNRRVYDALIKAKEEGVDVRVILDASDWNPGNTEKNRQLEEYLESNGVPVWWDPPDITTHSKCIIIDGNTVIVGSTNWTYYALSHNNEANVLIKSESVAEQFESYFQDILAVSTDEVNVIYKED